MWSCTSSNKRCKAVTVRARRCTRTKEIYGEVSLYGQPAVTGRKTLVCIVGSTWFDAWRMEFTCMA